MGVYNSSMKMPENCYLCGYSVCGCVTSNLILHCGVAEPMDFIEAQYHRHKDCPLVEVKAPHGDLIDRDALEEKVDDLGKTYGVSLGYIENAHTMLEAEG